MLYFAGSYKIGKWTIFLNCIYQVLNVEEQSVKYRN